MRFRCESSGIVIMEMGSGYGGGDDKIMMSVKVDDRIVMLY